MMEGMRSKAFVTGYWASNEELLTSSGEDIAQTRLPDPTRLGEYYFGRDTYDVHGLHCRYTMLALASRLPSGPAGILCSVLFSSLSLSRFLFFSNRSSFVKECGHLRSDCSLRLRLGEAGRAEPATAWAGRCRPGRRDDRTRDRNEARHAVVQQNRLRCVL